MQQVSLSTRQIFDRQDMQSMTKQQRRFAQEQLRHIFSHQMSKVSVAMQRKRQVSQKHLQLQQQKHQQLQKISEKLTQRLSHVTTKRQDNIRKRIESCRTYDEQWRTKMTEVEKRMRRENREAETRVKKFQKEQEEYRRRKEEQAERVNDRRSSVYVQPRVSEEERRYRSQLGQAVVEEGMNRGNLTSRNSRLQNPLDKSIYEHKLRSQRMQSEREQEIFQKALSKLDTINQRRKKIRSELEKDNKDMTERRPIGRNTTNLEIRRSESPKERANSTVRLSPRRGLPGINHLEAKRRKEMKEFREHEQILHKNLERNKKQHILRQIRQKVTQYKVLAQRSP